MITELVNKDSFIEFDVRGNIVVVSFDATNYSETLINCKKDTVKLNKRMSYEEVSSKLIHVRYSSDEEIKILSNAVDNGITDEYKEYVRWCNAARVEAKKYLGLEIDELAIAKADKIREIENYDSSDSVNSFTYNGVPMWIGLELRKNITHDINVLKAKNIEEFTFWNNGTTLTFPIAVLENLLVEIEIYALNCFNVTAQHKANVEALETIDEVNAYDYTTGYPNKLEL